MRVRCVRSGDPQRTARPSTGELFEYQTAQIRTTPGDDKIKTGDVDKGSVVYDGQQGWRVKSIVETSVKGRVGPGGVEGLLVVFERRCR